MLFGIFVYAIRGIELRRKSLVISRRVNSGHPLFIGYGRTGADSPMEVLSRTSFPDGRLKRVCFSFTKRYKFYHNHFTIRLFLNSLFLSLYSGKKFDNAK